MNIDLLVFDTDGVLTDGGLYLGPDGNEFRRFNIKDGLGLKIAVSKGFGVLIISSANSKLVMTRMRALGIKDVYIGIENKHSFVIKYCKDQNINLKDVAYMGDDLTDLEIMQEVGFPCAPADAVDEVKNISQYITKNKGGFGAVREICDLVIKTR